MRDKLLKLIDDLQKIVDQMEPVIVAYPTTPHLLATMRVGDEVCFDLKNFEDKEIQSFCMNTVGKAKRLYGVGGFTTRFVRKERLFIVKRIECPDTL